MAKVSQLSDDEILKMIEKHEKILQKLYKEKKKRGLGSEESEDTMEEFSYESPPPAEDATTSETYAFDLNKEGITQENILGNFSSGDEETGENTASYRITQILNLNKKELEELNQKEETKRHHSTKKKNGANENKN